MKGENLVITISFAVEKPIAFIKIDGHGMVLKEQDSICGRSLGPALVSGIRNSCDSTFSHPPLARSWLPLDDASCARKAAAKSRRRPT